MIDHRPGHESNLPRNVLLEDFGLTGEVIRRRPRQRGKPKHTKISDRSAAYNSSAAKILRRQR